MNSIVLTNIIRFIWLVLLQVLVLQSFNFGGEGSILGPMHFVIYPLFLFLLPHEMRRWTLILLGFLVGITVDIFYGSPGVHAAAGVATAFVRPIVLRFQEPKGGYSAGQSPTRYRLGLGPYLRYTSTLLLIHLLWYYSMELFSIIYIKQILLRTLLSFILSMSLILIHAFLVNPKN